uniref:PCI domain-containing protein n=1 Tax=Macrostomum lignano TaxID=282301 RepID=A0A1I8HKW8_9PLAT
MSEEVKKMEIDYSSQVDELIPKATELASHGKLNEALDLILSLEKHTRSLAEINEADGNIADAADVLQELQVETFGSMEKREKVEFILEQMRLCLAKRDYIRTQIISKKVNPKFFQTEPDSELKEKYYTLMIELHSHDKSYLSISKHHAAILQSCQPDTDKFRLHLRCCLANLLLAPHDNEQHDLLQRSLRHHARALESEPDYAELCGQFSGRELINWSELSAEHAERLRADCRLSDEDIEALRKRVTEHNVRVLAAYYTNIGLARAAHLLSLDVPDAEQAISDQVVSGAVSAKIDRLTGVVHFSTAQSATQLLTDWAHSLDSVMRLVGEVGHLINKERMVHQPA